MTTNKGNVLWMSLRLTVIIVLVGSLVMNGCDQGELGGTGDKSAGSSQETDRETDGIDPNKVGDEQPGPEDSDPGGGEDPDADPAETGSASKSKDPVSVIQEDEDQAAVSGVKGRDRLATVTIFMLAIFVGFEVITKVPPTLHTPLMSGSNAISGITVVGAIIVAGYQGGVSSLLGMLAITLATVNVVGGFLVTHRMLAMFKKR